VVAGYYALFGGEYSVMEVRQTRRALDEARAELEALRAENTRLSALKDSLENDLWTIERLAREVHGLVRPTEEAVRVTGGVGSDSTGRPDSTGTR
jgi:cell division protein FtsB